MREGTSLSRALANRTALSPGPPAAIDPARDELAFYPLIYWPVVATRPQPGPEAVTRIAAFMKQGGTILKWTAEPALARSLRDFVLSADGRTILQQYGFSPPAHAGAEPAPPVAPAGPVGPVGPVAPVAPVGPLRFPRSVQVVVPVFS